MQAANSKYQYLGQRIAQLARITPANPNEEQTKELAEKWYQLAYELKGPMPDAWKNRLYGGIREGLQAIVMEEML